MPTAAIKSFAKKTGKSEAEIEKYWNEAKEAAKSEKAKGDEAFYGTAMMILKNKLKKHAGLKEERLTFADYVGAGTRTHAHVCEGIEDKDFVKVFVKAGLANKKGFTEKDADPKELEKGIAVEYEHTTDKDIAKRIALDHLAELPDYYTRLLYTFGEDGRRRQKSTKG
jgi:hypothetical protein